MQHSPGAHNVCLLLIENGVHGPAAIEAAQDVLQSSLCNNTLMRVQCHMLKLYQYSVTQIVCQTL